MMRNVKILSIVSLGAEDPDFREVVSPIEGRRMGRILKRALWCSVKALQQAGIEKPSPQLITVAWRIRNSLWKTAGRFIS